MCVCVCVCVHNGKDSYLRRDYYVLYTLHPTPYSKSARIRILIVALGERDQGECGNSRRTMRVFSLMGIITWRLRAWALESDMDLSTDFAPY